jgi:uncharacterized cupin superfamily protein
MAAIGKLSRLASLRIERREAMAENRRHPQIVNVEDVAPFEQDRGGFGSRRRRLGTEAGNRALGCTHLEVAPGKTAFPFHFHSAFEEAIYILEGTGSLRLGGATIDVRAGDYVGLPPGPDSAHALTNTGATPLRYLALSSPAAPSTLDVVAYPDSKKVAYASGVDPVKGFRGGTWLLGIVRSDAPPLDYFDGEPLAEKKV